VDNTGKPDLSKLCSAQTGGQEIACMWWDAGIEMKTQVNAADPVGPASSQRRVLYAKLTSSGLWGPSRRPFLGTAGTTTADLAALRYDLWNGLHVPYAPDDTTTRDTTAQDQANAIITQEYALKVHRFKDSISGAFRDVTNILGDIFHSDPLVLDNPRNNKYFALNLGGTGLFNAANCDNGTDRGYQCFAQRHQFRRKLILVGSNDGMLHALDAGFPRK
jgi:hypothetical protein